MNAVISTFTFVHFADMSLFWWNDENNNNNNNDDNYDYNDCFRVAPMQLIV